MHPLCLFLSLGLEIFSFQGGTRSFKLSKLRPLPLGKIAALLRTSFLSYFKAVFFPLFPHTAPKKNGAFSLISFQLLLS